MPTYRPYTDPQTGRREMREVVPETQPGYTSGQGYYYSLILTDSERAALLNAGSGLTYDEFKTSSPSSLSSSSSTP